MVYGVILAAGNSTRMKMKDAKQFIKINNNPILYYSIDKFLNIKKIDRIIIVVNKKNLINKNIKQLITTYDKYLNNGKIYIISGGNERYDSVFNALNFINDYFGINHKDKILIHDSARPNVNVKDIELLISKLNSYKVITLSYKLSDSIKEIKKNQLNIKEVIKSVNRDDYYLIATPQGFDLKTLYNCYIKFYNNKNSRIKITDDLQIIEHYGKIKTYVLDSYKLNIKLTTKDDLKLIKNLL